MWYSTNELVELLGVSKQAIHKRAKKDGWMNRMVNIDGGGRIKQFFLSKEIIAKIPEKKVVNRNWDKKGQNKIAKIPEKNDVNRCQPMSTTIKLIKIMRYTLSTGTLSTTLSTK